MGNPNKRVILERFRGYSETMLAHGLLICDHYIQKTVDKSAVSMPLFEDMMKRPPHERPTAIFCSDDKIAIQVIRALNALGLSVPDDVSVVGFDNLQSYEISYNEPRITSIQQPLYQIDYDSILAINSILKGNSTELVDKTYSTSLVEHDTVIDCRI